MISIPPIPTVPPVAPQGAAIPGIDRYVGNSVDDFCQFHYGDVDDTQNHCAHFVCHVLGISVGATCESLLSWPQTKLNRKARVSGKGFSVRVNQVYNSLTKKGNWLDRTSDPCLIFATVPGNINANRDFMGEASKKHVGVYREGSVWHYGNTDDEVKKDTIATFQSKFKSAYGSNVVFLYGDLPSAGLPATETA